jgi:hypothetical protein
MEHAYAIIAQIGERDCLIKVHLLIDRVSYRVQVSVALCKKKMICYKFRKFVY